MIDFQVKKEVLPVIQVNFEEIKKALSDKMQQYTGLIVTEDSLSICKEDQKELASIRVKIDNYRKEKKKELSKPIEEFESKCKELISLVEKAEKPIKQGIEVFDNKKKEEKRQKILDIINSTIKAHGLNKEYADKLTVLDKYTNLTTSLKSVKEDIEQRAFYLVEEQAKEEETIQIIKTTIENENKTIKTKLQLEEFKNLIESNYSIPKILERINQMAQKIRDAESQPIPQKTVQEPIQEEESQDNKLYFVEFKIKGTILQTSKLGEFLRSNNIEYEVLNKGAIKGE